ncbi:TrkA family potassium uptake protein [candidate division WOR-3 bacterium]|nr:TrkA family potassium uptake protein [candidate division WOR-3 bacterium]
MRSIAVIGLGVFGSTLAKELTDKGAQVIAIDNDKNKVEDIKETVTYAVCLNSLDKNALLSIGVQDVDVAVVCIGDDVEANLLTTLLLKKMGVKRIWSRAINELQKEILKTLDVDQIIGLEEQMGITIARSLVSSYVSKRIPLSEGHSIAEIKIPDSFIGKTLREIEPRTEFKVNVVGIKYLIPHVNSSGEREFKEVFDDIPSPDEELKEDVFLLIAGSDKNIERFAKGK